MKETKIAEFSQVTVITLKLDAVGDPAIILLGIVLFKTINRVRSINR